MATKTNTAATKASSVTTSQQEAHTQRPYDGGELAERLSNIVSERQQLASSNEERNKENKTFRGNVIRNNERGHRALYELIGKSYGLIDTGLNGTEAQRSEFSALLQAHGLTHATDGDNPWWPGVKLIWWTKETSINKKTGTQTVKMQGSSGDLKYAKVMRYLAKQDGTKEKVAPEKAADYILGFQKQDLNGETTPAKMFGIIAMDNEDHRDKSRDLPRTEVWDNIVRQVREKGKAFDDLKDTEGKDVTSLFVMCACVVIDGEFHPVAPQAKSEGAAKQAVYRKHRKSSEIQAEQEAKHAEEAKLRAAAEDALAQGRA